MASEVKVSDIVRIWNPYEQRVWKGCDVVTKDDVSRALLVTQPKPICGMPLRATKADHANRIAALIQHGWTEPIDIDVGVPSLGHSIVWGIVDGNHRLAAAIFLGQETIMVEFEGELGYIEELFGIKI